MNRFKVFSLHAYRRAVSLVVVLCMSIPVGLGPGHAAWATPEIAVLASSQLGLDSVSAQELSALYHGRLRQLQGRDVTPLNAPSGSAVREQFLRQHLRKSEYDFTGYWQVRRYSGQGLPPRNYKNIEELIAAIQNNAQVVGYVALNDTQAKPLPEGIKVISIK